MPFHVKEEHKFGSKQYAYSQVWLNDNGDGKLYSHYSNCHRFDGDTYATIALLQDGHGENIGAIEIRAGMSARLLPGCNERELDKHFKVPREKLSQIAGIDIVHKELNTVDDRELWRQIIELIRKHIEEPKEEEEEGVRWKSD